jgi:PAS domain S-box-containing protein
METQSQHIVSFPKRSRESNETLEAQLMRVLQEREEQERILASIPSTLITLDEEDRVTHWNPAAESIFGIPAAQTLGRRLQQCSIRWDWQPVIRGIAACREKHAPVKLEDLRYTRPDGHEGIIGITLSPLGDRAEANGRVLLLGADITERRLMERQFAQALKMESIGRLAAGIAHEINTPTQYVGDNIRFLQDAMRDLLELLQRFQGMLECAKQGAVSAEQIAELEEAVENADLAYLLGLWGLPTSIVEAVAWHHRPSDCPARTFCPLTTVHVANALWQRNVTEEEGSMQVLDAALIESMGLSERLPVWQALYEQAVGQGGK